MAEIQNVRFVELLIKKTKAKSITWQYLDTNKSLCKSMGWMTENLLASLTGSDNTPHFNTEDSFYIEVDGTYIVIYVEENNPASLYVIPPTFKKILHLSADEYGQGITRLLNLVQSQFPNAEQFIKNFVFNRNDETNKTNPSN